MSDKKKILRLFHYGLFILTSRGHDQTEPKPYAASTVTWVSQASFEPPLIMLALRKESWANEAVRQSGVFVLNLVGKSKKEMAGKFFKEIKIAGNTINGFEFELTENGMPVFKEAAAYIECKTVDRSEKGDHDVIIAEVTDAKLLKNNEELLLLRDTGWNYGG
ncbi:flavin reductase family protein [bacterium]|nr:flavin reductase family protein [bacterium]